MCVDERLHRSAGKWGTLYGIDVRKFGGSLLVELWGELDMFRNRRAERHTGRGSSCREPVLVDLSGISSLDLRSARSSPFARCSTKPPGPRQSLAPGYRTRRGPRTRMADQTTIPPPQDPDSLSSEPHVQDIDSLATSYGTDP